MKKCAIITTYIEGNLAELLPDPEEYFVICADGGYAQAVEAGIKPDLIIGDLDSYKGDIPKDVPIEKLPVEKVGRHRVYRCHKWQYYCKKARRLEAFGVFAYGKMRGRVIKRRLLSS